MLTCPEIPRKEGKTAGSNNPCYIYYVGTLLLALSILSHPYSQIPTSPTFNIHIYTYVFSLFQLRL